LAFRKAVQLENLDEETFVIGRSTFRSVSGRRDAKQFGSKKSLPGLYWCGKREETLGGQQQFAHALPSVRTANSTPLNSFFGYRNVIFICGFLPVSLVLAEN
jgi:hypothetical protein